MKNVEGVEIKTWHILVVILLFTVFTNVLGDRELKRTPLTQVDDCLIELNNETFTDSISSRQCFVLFYIEDSDLCDKMEQNLNQIAKDRQDEMSFFKLNLDKYPTHNEKYNISGVPNTLVFNNGEEIKRIMGIVPVYNLEMIYNKVCN